MAHDGPRGLQRSPRDDLRELQEAPGSARAEGSSRELQDEPRRGPQAAAKKARERSNKNPREHPGYFIGCAREGVLRLGRAWSSRFPEQKSPSAHPRRVVFGFRKA
eukprot:3324451-Pyramimonas_sp.AAC.1